MCTALDRHEVHSGDAQVRGQLPSPTTYHGCHLINIVPTVTIPAITTTIITTHCRHHHPTKTMSSNTAIIVNVSTISVTNITVTTDISSLQPVSPKSS